MARRTGILVVFAALLALVLALGAPAALAHHRADHTQGGGSSNAGGNSGDTGNGGNGGNSEPTTTEDNDTNDNNTPNNVPDEGDNQHPSGKDRSVEEGQSGNQGNSDADPDGASNGGADKPGGSGGVDLADQDGNNGCGNDDDFEDDNNGNCGGPAKPKDNNPKTCPDGSVMAGNCGKGKGKVGGNRQTPCDLDAARPGIQPCEKVKGEIIVGNPSQPCDADATAPGVQPCDTPPVVGPGGDTPPVVGPDLEENPAGPVEGVLGIRLDAAQPAAVAVAAAPAVGAAAAAQGAVLPFTGASDLIPLVAVGLLLIAVGALSLRARSQA